MKELGVGVVALAMASAGWAQVTERVDVNSLGIQANGGGDLPPSSAVSADGRYVAFMSPSDNLVPGDTNGNWDVFVRDRLNGTTERVSVDSNGAQGNGFSGQHGIRISPDGRYVVFESRANSLVPGDTNFASDVFLRDRMNGTTERVSVDSYGAQGNNASISPSMSADGRYVAFTSLASNLVPGDTNATWDIFVRDRVIGTTERVSLGFGGAQGNLDSYLPAISAEGRYVAFQSMATNLVPGDTNGTWDVFLRDRQSGTTEPVSLAMGGGQANSVSVGASISADGRYVAFQSTATNLVPGDTNGWADVFLRDRRSGMTERVSLATGGTQGNGSSSLASISADGRCVSFTSNATNLVPGGTNETDVFLRDRLNGTTDLVSISTGGAHANGNSGLASVSVDGRYVVFRSYATNLVPGDTNGTGDVFLHDRDATGFTSFCGPGVGGVIACPCANTPSGPGRGCDNSSATGGASLFATGIAYLSMDSVVLTTSGERSSALSVLMQGNALVANGVVYGQGVRCAGGATKRLFVKAAAGGSITAPDFGAGDPTISARSAAKGDVIQPGQSRWYLVYYRDPVVLGGCPASSTFNATQTGQVTWWP